MWHIWITSALIGAGILILIVTITQIFQEMKNQQRTLVSAQVQVQAVIMIYHPSQLPPQWSMIRILFVASAVILLFVAKITNINLQACLSQI
jgi:hypothetical protein